MGEKIVVIMPAFNEEASIGPVVRSLKRLQGQKIIHEIIVVDDGSTDATAKIALKEGAETISLGKNFGKAFAFFEGVKAAKQREAKVIVTLDADLKPVSKKQIEMLIEPLIKRRQKMAVGNTGPNIQLSGQRAIRMSALEPLFRQNRKWESFFGIRKGRFRYRTGYGLEQALNILLAPQKSGFDCDKLYLVHTDFETTSRITGGSWTKESQRLMCIEKIAQARQRLARKIRKARKQQGANRTKSIRKKKQRRL